MAFLNTIRGSVEDTLAKQPCFILKENDVFNYFDKICRSASKLGILKVTLKKKKLHCSFLILNRFELYMYMKCLKIKLFMHNSMS